LTTTILALRGKHDCFKYCEQRRMKTNGVGCHVVISDKDNNVDTQRQQWQWKLLWTTMLSTTAIVHVGHFPTHSSVPSLTLPVNMPPPPFWCPPSWILLCLTFFSFMFNTLKQLRSYRHHWWCNYSHVCLPLSDLHIVDTSCSAEVAWCEALIPDHFLFCQCTINFSVSRTFEHYSRCWFIRVLLLLLSWRLLSIGYAFELGKFDHGCTSGDSDDGSI